MEPFGCLPHLPSNTPVFLLLSGKPPPKCSLIWDPACLIFPTFLGAGETHIRSALGPTCVVAEPQSCFQLAVLATGSCSLAYLWEAEGAPTQPRPVGNFSPDQKTHQAPRTRNTGAAHPSPCSCSDSFLHLRGTHTHTALVGVLMAASSPPGFLCGSLAPRSHFLSHAAVL